MVGYHDKFTPRKWVLLPTGILRANIWICVNFRLRDRPVPGTARRRQVAKTRTESSVDRTSCPFQVKPPVTFTYQLFPALQRYSIQQCSTGKRFIGITYYPTCAQ